jgi:hypothetical protein
MAKVTHTTTSTEQLYFVYITDIDKTHGSFFASLCVIILCTISNINDNVNSMAVVTQHKMLVPWKYYSIQGI